MCRVACSKPVICSVCKQFSDGSVISLVGILVYKTSKVKWRIKQCHEKLIARVKAIVDEDDGITIQETADALNISSRCVSNILKDKLCYSKVWARWIPCILSQENKGGRVAYSKSFLRIYYNCGPRRLHGDETWVHYYEPWEKSTVQSVRARKRKPASNCKEKSI